MNARDVSAILSTALIAVGVGMHSIPAALVVVGSIGLAALCFYGWKNE